MDRRSESPFSSEEIQRRRAVRAVDRCLELLDRPASDAAPDRYRNLEVWIEGEEPEESARPAVTVEPYRARPGLLIPFPAAHRGDERTR